MYHNEQIIAGSSSALPLGSPNELACLFLSKGGRPIVFIVSCSVTFTLLSVTSIIINSKGKNPPVRQRSISHLTSQAFLGSLLCGVLCSLRDGPVAIVTETSPGRGVDKAVVVLGGADFVDFSLLPCGSESPGDTESWFSGTLLSLFALLLH